MINNIFKKSLLLILFLLPSLLFSQKIYQKTFFVNGTLKEEGWLFNNQKNDYWKFYHKNGSIKKEGRFKNNLETKYWYFYSKSSTIEKEGHFKKGEKNNWRLFYDKNGNIHHKCQLKNNQKNGYCLLYKKKKLVKASKFKNGEKIKEWTDFSSFKKENSLSDLRP